MENPLLNCLPFRPIKGKNFRFYFQVSNGDAQIDVTLMNTWRKFISKDGGLFSNLTNNPVYISYSDAWAAGSFYVDLTAEEMNADVVCIQIQSTYSGARQIIQHIIYTSGTTGLFDVLGVSTATSAFSPAVLTMLVKAINEGYTVSLQDISNDGYNYYGLSKNGFKSSVWLIIRENINFTDVQYCQRNSTDILSEAWTERTILNYVDTIKI